MVYIINYILDLWENVVGPSSMTELAWPPLFPNWKDLIIIPNNQVSSWEEASKAHFNVHIAGGMAVISFGPPKHEAWQKECLGL